jgi:regulator of RNase E activity RraA
MEAGKPGREELLKAYQDLRVADVRDGMDTLMLHHVGSMDSSIRPLWRTRIFGIAKTAQLEPYTGHIPDLSPEDYWKWSGDYYQKVCRYPYMDSLSPGDVLVLDQGGVDAGTFGSANTLSLQQKGARGLITNGGVRDTDEIILQKVPVFLAFCSQKMVQGRVQFRSQNLPVTVGGVTVNPGDVIVADGDGVIVVPRDKALEVAHWARKEHERDKGDRLASYKELGLQVDATVTPFKDKE